MRSIEEEENNNINFRINIDNYINTDYNNKKSYIEIFTIREYQLYNNKYRSSNATLNDNECEYVLQEAKNPHDKIFRKILDKKENAVQIINSVLEGKFRITENEIEKYNSSYISNELKNLEADIVYKMKDCDLFFLIEHQTKIDYSMPYRVLKYEIAIMDSVIIDSKGKYKNRNYIYPRIIPIVLYTGDKEWNAKLDLGSIQLKWERFGELELSRYNIIDINKISNKKLLEEKSIMNKIMLIEKSKTQDEFIENLNKIYEEFEKNKYTKEEKNFFLNSVKVIVKRQVNNESVRRILKEIEKGEDDFMMQVIEMLQRERIKLREDSIREGKIEAIKNMIKENLPIELISKVTGFSENEIKSINKLI